MSFRIYTFHLLELSEVGWSENEMKQSLSSPNAKWMKLWNDGNDGRGSDGGGRRVYPLSRFVCVCLCVWRETMGGWVVEDDNRNEKNKWNDNLLVFLVLRPHSQRHCSSCIHNKLFISFFFFPAYLCCYAECDVIRLRQPTFTVMCVKRQRVQIIS